MKITNWVIWVFLIMVASTQAFGQPVMPLYEGKIPNSIKSADKEFETSWHFLAKVSRPTLTVYTPPAGSANGTAVIVCPGGGYNSLNIKMEGYSVAEQLNALGITAFVLKYRIPDDSTMVDKAFGPMQDAQRAIMVVKTNAKKWNIDTTKIGIIGFSAGGHLAASTGTHFNKWFIDNPAKVSLRPNFMILVYPVISFADSIGHQDSKNALIGKNANANQVTYFSNELQVTADTPPAFILHAGDDGLVSVKNSIAFYLALQKNKVPAGMHIFPKGEHGFFNEPAHSTWFKYCAQWLQENGWVKQTSAQ